MTQAEHPARTLSDLARSFVSAFKQAQHERLPAVEQPHRYRIEAGHDPAPSRHRDQDRER